MRFIILLHIACATLFIRPIQGSYALTPVSTSTGSGQALDPVVTDYPEHPALVNELDKRQLGEEFVAWLPYSRYYWDSQTCDPGSTYATWSTYGDCCAVGASTCNYATACLPDGTILYAEGESRCDPGQRCEVYTILPSSDSPLSDKRDIIRCPSSGSSYAGTWYREYYALTTDPSTTTTTLTQTETQTVTQTQTVEPDGSTCLQRPRTMQSILGVFMVVVLIAIY